MSKALVAAVRRELAARANPERAAAQQAYMKSAMPYYGLTTAELRAVTKPLFAASPLDGFDAWQDAVLALWRGAKRREERYAALGLAGHRLYRAHQTPAAMPLYEELVVTGAWWDTVDDIATHRVGDILRSHPGPMKKTMRAWSRDDDLWKRRTSIIAQVSFKKDTDTALLEACIAPSLARKEFWLRKAIGWALRAYAWHEPAWVKRYVKAHENELSGLSRREALKNLAPR